MLKIHLLLLGFLMAVPGLSQDKDFYILFNGGFQPYATIHFENETIPNSSANNGVGVLLGVQPTIVINNYTAASLFYVFEGHDKPILHTSAVGVKGHYFFKGEPKSPVASLAIGKGLGGNDGNANNGIYLATDFGLRMIGKKGNKSRIAVAYSFANTNDFDYTETGASPIITTDAKIHAFSLIVSTTTFSGFAKRRRDRERY